MADLRDADGNSPYLHLILDADDMRQLLNVVQASDHPLQGWAEEVVSNVIEGT